MIELNDTAAEVALAHGAHACTDITGFGFLGHLHEMMAASGVGAEVWYSKIPLLPGAADLAGAGYVCGGSKANLRYVAQFTAFQGTAAAIQILLADAITSGGLLLSLPAALAERAITALQARGVKAAALVGRVLSAPAGSISVRR
jgi:selenide,water dikinase